MQKLTVGSRDTNLRAIKKHEEVITVKVRLTEPQPSRGKGGDGDCDRPMAGLLEYCKVLSGCYLFLIVY